MNMILLYSMPKGESFKSEIKFKHMTKPRLVAYYKDDYETCTRAKLIHYFKHPNVDNYPLDLNQGFKQHKFPNATTNHSDIKLTLKWAMSFEGETFERKCLKKTVVYCSRDALVKIMLYALALQKGMHISSTSILACRHDDKIYMSQKPYPNKYSYNTIYMYQHERFMQFLFSDAFGSPPDIKRAIDENVQYRMLHENNLGKYKLIYSGLMHAIESDNEIKNFDDLSILNECKFVMAKQLPFNIRRDKTVRKQCSWWIQCYLANVKGIHLGKRDCNDLVHSPLKYIPASDIPKMHNFKSRHLFGFLNNFLEMIETVMTANSLEMVYEFYLNSMTRKITYCVHSGSTDINFIPEEYKLYKHLS